MYDTNLGYVEALLDRSARLRHFGFLALLAVIFTFIGLTSAAPVQAAPAFVQANYADPQIPKVTVSVTYGREQTNGNLNVIVIGWNDSTTSIASVTDTRGNAYQLASTPTKLPGVAGQAIYYAAGIVASAGGTNVVTVTFASAAPFPDVRIAEYSGVTAVNPLDAATGAGGASSRLQSGNLTTRFAGDLLVGASYIAHSTTSAGSGFTTRLITNPNSDLLEDTVAGPAGTYSASARQSPGGWYIMQVAAFRAISGDAATTASLAANPTSVAAGAASTLTWTSSNATSCLASNGWSGTKATSGTAATAALSSTTQFTIACSGLGGTATASTTVTVVPAIPPATVTLTASPTSVISGGSSTVTWSSSGATVCTAIGGWTSNPATSGSKVITGLSASTTFQMTCSGAGGSGSGSATVTVTPPDVPPPLPTVALTANPSTVSAGVGSTLVWSSTNADNCAASGGWTSSTAPSGSASTGALTSSKSFSMTCYGGGGFATATALVTVLAPGATVSLTATPSAIASGGTTILNWSSTNASTCAASGGWSGAQGTSGSITTAPITTPTTYSLTCSGPGGSGSASAAVTILGTTGMFPLQLVGTRYLQDAQGNPFLVHGDSPWDLITQISDADVDVYLADRQAKGMNTILVELIEHLFSNNSPADFYGNQPFKTKGDFSTPNDVYFNRAFGIVAKAQQRGMLVLLMPAYMGYGGGAEGWYAEMSGNGGGTTKLQAYGAYLANKAKAAGLRNIIWVNGGDYNPPDKTLLGALAAGILGVDPSAIFSFHGERNNLTGAGELNGAGDGWLGINTIYTDDQLVINCARNAYAQSSKMPFFLIEAIYENEAGGFSAAGVRAQAYQAVLSGAMGQLMGNNPVWCFSSNNSSCLAGGWKTALSMPAAGTLQYLKSLLLANNWTTLVPDSTGSTLVNSVTSSSCTSATSASNGSRPVAARAGNGATVLVYTPGSAFSVNLAQLAGPNVNAAWFDPTSGVSKPVAGSPFANTGTRAFNPSGANSLGDSDWVLVLKSTN